MKDISTEVIGEIGHTDFGGGTVNTNGTNKEPHRPFEVGKRMFNEGPDFRSFGIGFCGLFTHGHPFRLAGMNVGFQSTLFQHFAVRL